MTRVRLFSDFNCPFCYAMHERLFALGVMERVAWHGVQHAPHLPQPPAAWAGHLGAELRQEVQAVQRLAPDLPIALPPWKPNTRPAIALCIRALTVDGPRASTLIRALYRRFWVDGADISDAAILRQEAARQGFDSTLFDADSSDTSATMRAWERLWHETEQAGVPLLEREDHTVLVGLMPIEAVRRFLSL